MDTTLMDDIERTGSRLEKERLLSRETDTRFLRWALDPMVTFGVTADKTVEDHYRDVVSRSPGSVTGWWDAFDSLLGQLSRRELTGNKASGAVGQLLMSAPDPDTVTWACRVINGDLRCGVQLTTVNKVFPGLIEPFGVMLAREFDPERHDVGGWIAQPKLDGLRMLVVEGRALSRGGRDIETVGHILEELSGFDGFVFDGEVMGVDDFDASSGRTRRKGSGPDTSLTYHVFDVVHLDQWKAKGTDPLSERTLLLERLFHLGGHRHVRVVPSTRLPLDVSLSDLSDNVRDRFVAQGYEGAMLKDPDAPYAFTRSDRLLKFKPFRDADLRVVGFQEGRGRHRGRLGALLCEDEDGVQTRVGSGFGDLERDAIWQDQELFLGRTVQVKYQNTTEKGALRFPTFDRWRDDK